MFIRLFTINTLHLEIRYQYVGPTPESNWVIPGRLLVGAYPASEDDDETFDLIVAILRQGVSKFVCLQSEVSKMVVVESGCWWVCL